MTLQETPVWFITGSSTGFGRELAKLLLDQGFRVVATARDAAKLGDLVKGHEANALALSVDVTDKQTIIAAMAEAEVELNALRKITGAARIYIEDLREKLRQLEAAHQP